MDLWWLNKLWTAAPHPTMVASRLSDGMMGRHGCVGALTPTHDRVQVTQGTALEVEKLCKDGQVDKVLETLLHMDQDGTAPSVQTCKKLLQACMKKKASIYAKKVHALLAKHGLDLNRNLGELLVAAYVNGGTLADGLQLFGRLQHRSVFSWTAIISGYRNSGQYREAIACYERMQDEGVQPDKYTLVSLLKACSSLEDVQEGKRIHADVRKYGFDSDVFLGNTLVSMYAKCGSLTDAQHVFAALSQRDVVSWNALIAAYAQQDKGREALQIYAKMQDDGVPPDDRTFVSVLQACGTLAGKEPSTFLEGQNVKLASLQTGKKLHYEASLCGFEKDVFVGSTLVSMYSRCGSHWDAEQVLGTMSQQDVVPWNAMIAAYSQHGQGSKALQIFFRMQREKIRPNDRTFVGALQACAILAEQEESIVVQGHKFRLAALQKGKEIHAEIIERSLDSSVFVGSALVSMYAKCGSLRDAEQVFDRISNRNLVLWTAMITAYAQHDQGEKSLELYRRMQAEGIRPDTWTFASALQACGTLAEKEESCLVHGQNVKVMSLQKGRDIHAEAAASGLMSNTYVANTLVSMYSKCGSLRDAHKVFAGLRHRDLVSWNTMIAAYAQQEQGYHALLLYSEMRMKGIRPDAWTFASALQACASLAEKEEGTLIQGQSVKVESRRKGKEIHSEAASRGFESDVFVSNSLVSMYARCGCLMDARRVFDQLRNRDVVTWNAMIAAYAQQDQGEKTLQILELMLGEGIPPTQATFLSALEACSNTGALETCVHIHQLIVRNGLECSLPVANCLIHAYGKCGSTVDAQNTFDSLPEPDVVSWNALMAGYARQGDYKTCVQRYHEMCATEVKPSRVTFLAVLSACSHAGMVDEGLECFESMSRDNGISAEVEHYVCVIDLLGRAGLLTKAQALISTMPLAATLHVWLSLLGACRKHNNVQLGKCMFDCARALEPQHPSAYVLMGTLYAQAGMWDSVKEVDELRLRARAWKKPGRSWIEFEQKVQTFLVGDRRCPENVYRLLNHITSALPEAGWEKEDGAPYPPLAM